MKRPLTDTRAEEIAKSIDQLRCDPNGRKKIAELIRTADHNDLLSMVGLLGSLAEAYAEVVKSLNVHQFQANKEKIADILSKINRPEGMRRQSEWSGEMEEIAIKWRNHLMAANAARFYCTNIHLGKKLPIILSVGNSHVDGILSRLKTMATKSGLDQERIKTRRPIFTEEERKK